MSPELKQVFTAARFERPRTVGLPDNLVDELANWFLDRRYPTPRHADRHFVTEEIKAIIARGEARLYGSSVVVARRGVEPRLPT